MFYVYELIDPRDDAVFYVGKGSGKRYGQHEKDARRGRVGPKCDRIRAILAAGHPVGHRIVKEFKSEAKAYDHEIKHINTLGRANLTNILPGGPFPYGSNNPDARDNEAANALMQIALKTDWFRRESRFIYGGVWHPLPMEKLRKIASHFWKLVDRRGWRWVVLRTVRINSYAVR